MLYSGIYERNVKYFFHNNCNLARLKAMPFFLVLHSILPFVVGFLNVSPIETTYLYPIEICNLVKTEAKRIPRLCILADADRGKLFLQTGIVASECYMMVSDLDPACSLEAFRF